MLIARITGATRTLGQPEDWDETKQKCNSLPIKDIVSDSIPFMVSAWEPTPDELSMLNAGGKVHLWISGIVHPVVCLTVE